MDDRNEKKSANRRDALGVGLAGLAALAATDVADAQTAEDNETLVAEIEEVLEQTQARWNSGKRDTLKEMWDADDPEPWYVPEEYRDPFMSWAEIDEYWNPNTSGLEYFQWGFSNVRAKRLAPDIALSIFDHFYELKVKGDTQKPWGGFDRCLAIFRKKPEGWRHILYAQCPLGAEIYVRAMREQLVRPGFEAWKAGVEENQFKR
jgi:hypothetical protein